MFKDKDFTENEIYEKLLNDKLSVNLGYLYENIVAQCLAANGNELFYHTIMNTQSKHNYEIDFILAKKNKIVPLEVKSSGYKTHKSLDVFTENDQGAYNRQSESHQERCYTADQLRQAAVGAGLMVEGIYSDFNHTPYTKDES